MTTSEDQMPELTEENIERLKENMEKVEKLSKRLIEVMAAKKPHTHALDGPIRIFSHEQQPRIGPKLGRIPPSCWSSR